MRPRDADDQVADSGSLNGDRPQRSARQGRAVPVAVSTAAGVAKPGHEDAKHWLCRAGRARARQAGRGLPALKQKLIGFRFLQLIVLQMLGWRGVLLPGACRRHFSRSRCSFLRFL